MNVCTDWYPYITPSDVICLIGISALLASITIFHCINGNLLNVVCIVYQLGNDVRDFLIVTTVLWFILVWFVVYNVDKIDDEEEVISIGVPTGGAPPLEITSISTTADGTCNEETTW